VACAAGALALCAESPAGASGSTVYDPALVPRASYVAPLAPYPAPSYRAKDFTIVRVDSLYHLFYTRVQRFVPRHYDSGTVVLLNETTFGHAVSPDLEHWTELDTVLTVRPGEFDAHHLWAPSIVERDGVFFLFYAGVHDQQASTGAADWIPRWQSIGLAVSRDRMLRTWVQRTNPVWGPCPGDGLPGVGWATCDPILSRGTADFRDPFVLPPAAADPSGAWLLFFTARPVIDQYNYVVGVAQTGGPNDLWADLGPLWDTYYPPGNSKIESPHVFRHGTNWNLFYSGDDGVNGIIWHSSVLGPLGPWLSHGSIAPLLLGQPGYSTDGSFDPTRWFASEYLADDAPGGPVEILAVVTSYDAPPEYNAPPPGPTEDISIIEFRQMIWQADGTFALAPLNPVRSLAWAQSAASPGQMAQLRIAVEDAAGRFADLTYGLAVDGVESPLPPGALDLPSRIPLYNGQQAVLWSVPRLSATRTVELVAHLASQPLRLAARLAVLPTGDQGGSDDDLPILRSLPLAGSAPGGPADRPGSRLALTALGSTPLGPGPGLALEMPAAGRVRLDVFDVRGRLVRRLVEDERPAGLSLERWDGRTDGGPRAGRGIYFARALTPFGARTARLLLVP
jgi:hypothetical protein